MSTSVTRRSRVFANLVFTVIGQAAGILGQLLLVPAFLAAWGDVVYGDWLAVSAISAYLNLTDMGMQMYVVNRLTRHALQSEQQELDSTFQSALLLYLAVSTLAVLGLTLLAFLAPWEVWFGPHALGGREAIRVIVLLLGGGVLASVWGGFLAALYRVAGEPQRQSAFSAAQRLVVLAVTLGVLLARRTPVLLAGALLVLGVGALAWLVIDIRRREPTIVFSLKDADAQKAIGMIVPSGLFALLALANGLTVQGTLLVTSAALGPAAVTTFSTSRTLANAVRQFVAVVGSVAWPEFTRLDAGAPSSALASAHRLLVKTSALITIWIVGSLWFTGPLVHHWWTSGRTAMNHELFHLLMIHALVMTPSWASAVLLAATNRHQAWSLLHIVQGVMTVALSWSLVRGLGLEGVGWSLLVTDFLLFGLIVPFWSLRVVSESLYVFLYDIYLKLAVGFACILTVAWLVHCAALSPALEVVATALATLVPVVLGATLWARADERELITSAIHRRTARVSG